MLKKKSVIWGFTCQLLGMYVCESSKESEILVNEANRNSFKGRQTRAGLGFSIKESKPLTTALQPWLSLASTTLPSSRTILPELTLFLLPSALLSVPHTYQVSAKGHLHSPSSLLECFASSSWYGQVLLVRSKARRLLNLILSPLWLPLFPHSLYSSQ